MKEKKAVELQFGFFPDDPNAKKETEDGKIIIRSVHPEFRVDGVKKEIAMRTGLINRRGRDLVFIKGDYFPTYAVPRENKDGDLYAVMLSEPEVAQIFKNEFKRIVFAAHFERYVEETLEKDPIDLKKKVDYDGMAESFYDALMYDSGNDYYAEAFDEWFEYHFDDFAEEDDEDDEEEEEDE